MPGLGTSFGRGGATTAQQDLANSDAILIMGSSMAENHPVGFRWVIKARERGATIIHVDPRFSPTSAMADLWVPLRAGSDIVFLGALVNYVLEHEPEFRDYVVHYTNAATIIGPRFPRHRRARRPVLRLGRQSAKYSPASWSYEGRPPSDHDAAHGARRGRPREGPRRRGAED